MVNPYRPAPTTRRVTGQPSAGRLIRGLALVSGFGVASWVAVFFGLRDVEIRQEPGYQIVLHQTELTISFGLGCIALAGGVLGIAATLAAKQPRLVRCVCALDDVFVLASHPDWT